MSTTKAKGKTAGKAKPSPKAVADKAVKEIMAEAEAKVEEKSSLILVAEDDQLGRSPDKDTSKVPAQRDYIPGTRRTDLTELPERAYDEELDIDRQVTLPKEYHPCWVADALVQRFRVRGYKFALYDGGNQSGLAPRGFKKTGLFERTLSGHVRNGDTVLMFVPMRLYEEFKEEDRIQIDRWNRAAQSDYHNLGYRHGIKTFEETSGGRREYN